MVGVAVKVADAPTHSGLLPVVIATVTAGVTLAVTVIVMLLLFIVTPPAHATLLVIAQ